MTGRVTGDAEGRSATDHVSEAASATMDELVRLAALIARRLGDVGATVATAESCTGGLIGHVLTEISGSSDWYLGGAVVYSNALKERLADVPAGLIVSQGAVSEAVAGALAIGIRQRVGSDLAVAVTGIAGPTGGTPGKPVGLTFVAVADASGTAVEQHVWDGDRSANKRASAHAALRLLLERLTTMHAALGRGAR